MEPILEHGLDALPDFIRTIINAAMELEPQQHLGVAPYERNEKRRGYANGYKQRMVATPLGKITFDLPQVREGGTSLANNQLVISSKYIPPGLAKPYT